MGRHCPTCEPLLIAHCGPEERRLFRFVIEPGYGDVLLDKALEVVADGVFLAGDEAYHLPQPGTSMQER